MRTTPAPRSAQSAAISGSPRRAVTSLTIAAPGVERRRGDRRLRGVDRDRAPPSRASPATTGIDPRAAPPPRRPPRPPAGSIRRRRRGSSAPAAASSRPCAIAASGSRYSPPSENESGVTLTTPISFIGVMRSAAASDAGAESVAAGESPGREAGGRCGRVAAGDAGAARFGRARARGSARAGSAGSAPPRRRRPPPRACLRAGRRTARRRSSPARAGSSRSGRARRGLSLSRSLAVWWALSTMRRISSSISRAISSE